MGKAIRASALVLLLTCSASAGTIQNGVYDPPPPPPSESVHSEGVMGNGSPQSQPAQEAPANDAAETSLLVEIALNLLTLL